MYVVSLAEMYLNYSSHSAIITMNLVWSCDTQYSF